jgi:hypothetical protein
MVGEVLRRFWFRYAVDAQLAGSDQIELLWSMEVLRQLASVMRAATKLGPATVGDPAGAREDKILSTDPSKCAQAGLECCDTTLRVLIALSQGHEHAYPPHPLVLLRARSERPRCRRAAEKRDERASFHGVNS